MADDEKLIFSDNKKTKTGIATWKVVVITSLITFAFLVAVELYQSATSKELRYVPIITPLFNFPPHIFKREDGAEANKELPFDTESSFFTPLVQFIIIVAIYCSLIAAVVFM